MQVQQASTILQPELQQAATAGQLGSLLKSYTMSRVEIGKNLSWGIACLLIGCAFGIPALLLLMAEAGFFGGSSPDSSGLVGSIVFLVIALIVFIGAGTLLGEAMQGMGQKVYLFQKGFILVRWGRIRVYPWTEIQSIWQHITKHYKKTTFGEKYKGTTYKYTIKHADGKKLELNNQVKDIEDLGKTMTQQFSTFVFPTTLASLEAGKTLDFGPWKINAQGISNKRGQIPWQDIQTYQIVDGRIYILRKKGAGYWGNESVQFIPNILVFTALVDYLLTIG
ncbi:MAG TPA: DUF6585 family protein [Ktedonobacteraceae bacterium]|nr:DUF6585 family protein [Ktedonobacteraceae bacterium]